MVSESQPVVGILAAIEREHRALTSLMARLSLEELTARAGDGWSAIDTLNHITAWQENALRVAQGQAGPAAPEVDPSLGVGRILDLDVESFNAEILTQHRQRSLAEALDWHKRVHAALLKALAVLPPERLLGGPGPHGARQWLARPAIVHAREHRQELEARLARSARR